MPFDLRGRAGARHQGMHGSTRPVSPQHAAFVACFWFRRDREHQDWKVASLECLTNDRGSSFLRVLCPRESDQVRIALRGGAQDVLAGYPDANFELRLFRARAVTRDELAPPASSSG